MDGLAENQVKSRFIVWAVVISQISTLGLIGAYAVLGSAPDVWLSVASHGLGWVLLALWLATRSPARVSQAMVVGLVVVFTVGAWVTHSRSYLAWIGLVALLAVFLGGVRRQGLLLGVVAVSAGVVFTSLATLDDETREVGSPSVRALRAGSIVPVLFLVGLAYDRARSRALEQARAEHARALVSQQAQTRFLAKVSHELRTPLNGILGMAESLRGQPLKEQGQRDLDTLERSAASMLSLVNDLIDVARAASGDFTVATGRVDLVALVKDVVALGSAAGARKGVPVTLRGPAGELWVTTDGTRLRQVLGNLITNAVKFTDEGTVVVGVEATREGDVFHVVISVNDSGPGIPDEERPRLFRAFEQLSTSTGRGGTGLGLAISQEIITRMGGTLELTSSGPAGSTFRLRLDMPLGSPPPPVAQALPGPALHGRVLVVDDNEINRTVASRLLSRLGVDTVTAASGEEALEKVRAGAELDLVLMDLQMPGLDGFETTEQLKAASFAAPVVALTASATEGTRESCRAAGMVDCLQKPVRLADLSELLARMGMGRAVHRGSPVA